MTISYAGNFAKLLLRWKGSIWKTVWKELLIYIIFYYVIRIIYLFSLELEQQRTFEFVVVRFEKYTERIPLTFLLGFYISAIVSRWWSQFDLVAWPDDLMSLVCAIIPGSDDTSRLKRHSIARYLILTSVLSWREISIKIRRRFPTISHLVKSGLMTEEEENLFNKIAAETVRWYLPLQWCQNIVQEAFSRGKIPAPIAGSFYNQLSAYRQKFRSLYCYDWVCIPLVYTQVAALATYGYFGFCLIGHQFLIPNEKLGTLFQVDMYVPLNTILQFLFYVGWFKVGQDLMRPFGTDDDDIEMNYILDRNIQAAFTLANNVPQQMPLLVKDKFWLDASMLENATYRLPHTNISLKTHEHPPKLHAYVHLKNVHDSDMVDQVIVDSMEIKNRENKKRRIHF